jgi:O-antigen biosynthesis protein
MPTRRRRQWVPQAIECLLAQTWQDWELLILQDEGDDLQDLVTSDERIKLFTAHGRQTIGWKRNWLCGRARGELIFHWDDDDFSFPDRIAAQLADVEAHPEAAVYGFRTLHFWDSVTRQAWLYSGRQNWALGTTLCYRRSYWSSNKFPNDQVGEDMEFVKRAARQQKMFGRESGGLMVARNHGANTSGRYAGRGWSKIPTADLPGGFTV